MNDIVSQFSEWHCVTILWMTLCHNFVNDIVSQFSEWHCVTILWMTLCHNLVNDIVSQFSEWHCVTILWMTNSFAYKPDGLLVLWEEDGESLWFNLWEK